MPQLKGYTLKELLKFAFKDTDEGAEEALTQFRELRLKVIDGWYDPDTGQVGFTYARMQDGDDVDEIK
jgi:hypothetical protein